MEWVETTGRTTEEAKSLALDQLGVDESDAEFEIIDEPRAGLFGRVRGEARVRARVRPTQPRAKAERRDRKKKTDRTAETDAGATANDEAEAQPERSRESGRSAGRRAAAARPGSAAGTSVTATPTKAAQTRTAQPKAARNGANDEETTVDAQQVGAEAKRFVEELVAAFGLDGATTVRCEGDEIDVMVVGDELGVLVGPRGATLQAVQELARVAAQRRLGDHETRLRVDVGGYRERRKEALSRFADQVAGQVVLEGAPKRLEPMSSSDRKIVHDVLASFEGVTTHSEGEDPRRCVVIVPAND